MSQPLRLPHLMAFFALRLNQAIKRKVYKTFQMASGQTI